ncbi:MAG: hypothetical protein NC033_05070 [Clostridiales bacterium]|nr:hypothetical protein [Clostridiales bacterium]
MKAKKLCTIFAALAFAASAALAAPAFTACNKGGGTKQIIIKVPSTAKLNVPDELKPEGKNDITNVSKLLQKAADGYLAQTDADVKFKVVEFASGEESKAITNTFGTSDAADILYDGFFNMSSFIHTGKAVPLDDVLSADTLADLTVKYVEDGKYNGRQYMIPYMTSQNILIYNKKMLRECLTGTELMALIPAEQQGEQQISHWTIEQWTAILDAMADKYSDGCGKVPMMMYAKDNQGDTHIMTMLRAFGSELFDENDNFALTGESTVKALEWLQSGVDKGWYLPVADYKSMNDNSSKFKMDELAFYNFNLGSSNYGKARDDKNDEYGFVNYPGDKCTFFSEGFEVFDNGDNEKIAIAKDFIRFFYEDGDWLEYSASAIPVSGKVMDKYKDSIFLLDKFNENAACAVDFTRNLPNWQGSSDSVREVFYPEIAKLLRKECTPEQCAQSLQEKLNAAIESGRANSKYHD